MVAKIAKKRSVGQWQVAQLRWVFCSCSSCSEHEDYEIPFNAKMWLYNKLTNVKIFASKGQLEDVHVLEGVSYMLSVSELRN